MSVKSTIELTREKAEKMYIDNFINKEIEMLKLRLDRSVSLYTNNLLEKFLEQQDNNEFNNYLIIERTSENE